MYNVYTKMEDINREEYSITTDINGIRGLKSAIEYLIQVWPGSPARPPEEQELLWTLRDTCTRCELEHLISLKS